ncbi:FAD-dependent oxidoreductase [Prosthecobacter sp.]|uniref:FAD-dependent oxidoreductase n=1 Tax=Prosthecobacter sp. TaxID=1965333 RepID=UPI0037840D40
MKLNIFLITLLLISPLVLGAGREPETTRDNITLLQKKKLISEPEYWMEHAVEGGKCDGAKVAGLLVELVKVLKPVATKEEALDVLVQRALISSPDYWKKNAVAGGQCNGANVAIVLDRIVGRLPMEAPKSASVKPLEAMAFAKLKESYDVVIAGAGTGGCGAAMQAARMGCTVLLLEETDWIGGQMNAAAVTSMDEGGTLVRKRGLYREWCGLVASHYQPLGINFMTAYWNSHTCLEPRVGRHLLHVLLGDARGKGVLDLVERARVSKVIKMGDTVTGVEVVDLTEKDGKTRAIQCRVLIDATEWGDVIPLTGARYRVGNCTSDAIDVKRRVQDNTWTAVVKQYSKGVPEELRIAEAPPGYTEKVHAAFVKTLVDGEKVGSQDKPWTWATFIGYRGMPDSSRPGDSPPITRTHLNYNNDYVASVAEIEDPVQRKATDRAMRLKTLHLIYFMQHTLGKTDWAVANDEGYDTPCNREAIDEWLQERPELGPYRAIFYQFSIIPYVRESRRIIGLHTMTAREIERKNGKPVQFPHTVALGDYPVDMHGSMQKQWLELDLDREADIPDKFGGKGSGPFAIPFESFIPEKVDGFLPAEKNISQSRMVNGATRLQPHTMMMGQAVGAIAALSIQNNVQPRALDPGLVQRVLLEAGSVLNIEPMTKTK